MTTVPWYKPDREPNEKIGGPYRPYIKRWHLARKSRIPFLSKIMENVYLHNVVRSDDDRALHCHPWWSISLILRTGYWEHTPRYPKLYPNCDVDNCLCRGVKRTWHGPGSIIIRRSDAIHRLELEPGLPETWTLFITGRKIREWGFYCLGGWKHWKEFGKTGC